MDDDGRLSMRHWSYFEQPMRGSLGLQLMSSGGDRDRKPLQSNGPFLRRDGSTPEPSVPMNFVRDGWIHQSSDNSKMIHMLSVNQHQYQHQHQHHLQHQQQQHHQANYNVIPHPPATDTIQILQHQEQPNTDKALDVEKPNGENDASLKKRSQGRSPNPAKNPKPKKPRKAAAPKNESANGSAARGRGNRKSEGVIINGVSYDISRIPTPVCTCTGNPQQCYRWGLGGWQSACCTTNHSEYPLPMSTKRRGARIAGRKMSQGAFTKVLEKLVGEEGYNLSNPIDLKPFWAKHGTNKFVTIR